MKIYPSFDMAIRETEKAMVQLSYPVDPNLWQGRDVSSKPESEMRELFNTSFQVGLKQTADLDYWRKDIGPNLPWADVHFEKERMSGLPINPGESYKIWPWGNSAETFKDSKWGNKFNHTYAERYWPIFAGHKIQDDEWRKHGRNLTHKFEQKLEPQMGIRYRYADIDDLVNHLLRDPKTRQAYLPIWFPEDGSHNDRKPCTLGYHFLMRNGYFHMTYYIRSCDITHHFRDDLYLSLRLQLEILDRLREFSNDWIDVELGFFVIHCASLHCFINDWRQLKKKLQEEA